MQLRISAVSLDLPDDFEHEVTVVSRGQAVDGYRPNVRITAQSTFAAVGLDTLARQYEERLGAGVPGQAILTRNSRRRIGSDEALELGFRIDLGEGRIAIHQVLIVVRPAMVITLAASRREDDAELVPVLTRVLASVSVEPGR